jgi:hypothetical protein
MDRIVSDAIVAGHDIDTNPDAGVDAAVGPLLRPVGDHTLTVKEINFP